MKRTALAIVLAAVLIAGPRVWDAYTAADGHPLDPELRYWLLSITALATAVVLTVGAALLAHAATLLTAGRGLLVSCWIVVMVGVALLITPVLSSALARVPLSDLLSDPARASWQAWMWAGVAVVLPELVAGGAMVVYAMAQGQAGAVEDLEAELLEVARERDRYQRRLRDLSEQRALEAETTPPEPYVAACGASFRSPQAKGGHVRSCAECREAAA